MGSCGDDACSSQGQCLTAAWEASFQQMIQTKVQASLREGGTTASNGGGSENRGIASGVFLLGDDVLLGVESSKKQNETHAIPPMKGSAISQKRVQQNTPIANHAQVDNLSAHLLRTPPGELCSTCNSPSITLYCRNGNMVCKRCRRRR